MATLFDLSVKTRAYTTANGEEKVVWKNVGSVLETKKGGQVILLDRTFNPAGVPVEEGRDQIMIYMFDAPVPRTNTRQATYAAPVPAPALEDDGVLLKTLAILDAIREAIGDDGEIPLTELAGVIRREYARLNVFESALDSLTIDLLKLREDE